MLRRPVAPPRIVVAAGLVALLGLTTAGCGEKAGGGSDTPVEVAITFENGEVTPSGDRVEAEVGQPVDLVVTADEPGTLHVHSEPEQEFAYDEGTETFKLEFDRSGVITVESHELDVVIVQVEVRP